MISTVERYDSQNYATNNDDNLLAFREIADLLLEAGYYRIRNEILSAFDKVVGGLCWCIQTSGPGVDADILFVENSTIGEKIKLSEQIVRELRTMMCPFPLQAHQIQGSDWPAVLPVAQWLVRRGFESRKRTTSLLRKESEFFFRNTFHNVNKAHSETSLLNCPPAPDIKIDSLKFQPRQRLRLKVTISSKILSSETSNKEEMKRVQACLLEYGEKASRLGIGPNQRILEFPLCGRIGEQIVQPKQQTCAKGAYVDNFHQESTDFLRRYRLAEKSSQDALVAAEVEKIKLEDALLQIMQPARGAQDDPRAVHKLVTASPSIRRREGALQNHELARSSFERSVHDLQNGISEYAGILEQLQRSKQLLDSEILASKLELKKALDRESNMKTHTGFQALKKELCQNIEQEKAKERIGKRHWRQTIEERQSLAVASEGPGNDYFDKEKTRTETQCVNITNEYAKALKTVAEKADRIAKLTRSLDECPSQTELLQYEKRLIELCGEVEQNLQETRKYFSAYNMLEQIRILMERQVTVINSVKENFEQGMASDQSRHEFTRQMSSILHGIKDALASRLEIEAGRRNALHHSRAAYKEIMTEEREYIRLLHSFQAVCVQNINLLRSAAT